MYSLTRVGAKNKLGAMTTLELFARKDFNQMIEELVSLHKRGILTDDEFEKIIRIVSSNYIEQEISKKVNETIEDKILPLFYGGLKFVR
jgi:ribosomal protein S13